MGYLDLFGFIFIYLFMYFWPTASLLLIYDYLLTSTESHLKSISWRRARKKSMINVS